MLQLTINNATKNPNSNYIDRNNRPELTCRTIKHRPNINTEHITGRKYYYQTRKKIQILLPYTKHMANTTTKNQKTY